jgi:uroporphyrinogen-III decarboxylase
VTISREDIEAKANEIVAAVNQTKESAKDTAVLAGVVVACVVLAAFIIGRRRGSRTKAMVEVYRV